MPQSPTLSILSLAAFAIGTSLCAQAQESGEPEELPIAADDIAVTGGKTCYVSKVRFDNEGAYDVFHFEVSGHELLGHLQAGRSRTWKLSKTDLKSGDTFFLEYTLDHGNKFKKKNCKKDGTTLKYHPDGNTWSHWSKGTTKFNNRCRNRNSNKCITSVD